MSWSYCSWEKWQIHYLNDHGHCFEALRHIFKTFHEAYRIFLSEQWTDNSKLNWGLKFKFTQCSPDSISIVVFYLGLCVLLFLKLINMALISQLIRIIFYNHWNNCFRGKLTVIIKVIQRGISHLEIL